MFRHLVLAILLTTLFSLGDAYSKYGRSCQDIGCPNNEVCVMEEDPCSIYARNECGRYPTCKRVSNAAITCSTYVCPPSQTCRMNNGEPKCFEDPGATGSRHNAQPVQNYNPGSPSANNNPSAPVYPYPAQPQNPVRPQNPYNPNYPQYPPTPNSRLYPNIPSGSNGQTTSRPNVYQPGQQVNPRGGYQGGAVGSGYPGYSQPGSYPGYAQNGQQGNYGGQNYPYPTQRGGYPTQRNGYPSQGNGQNYGGYNQGGYNNNNNKPSGQDGFFDKVGDTLKTIGLFWFFLKFIISRTHQMLR